MSAGGKCTWIIKQGRGLKLLGEGLGLCLRKGDSRTRAETLRMKKREPSKELREEHSRQREGQKQRQNLELESEILG